MCQNETEGLRLPEYNALNCLIAGVCGTMRLVLSFNNIWISSVFCCCCHFQIYSNPIEECIVARLNPAQFPISHRPMLALAVRGQQLPRQEFSFNGNGRGFRLVC